ncbi:DUF4145 domain-containing protein [Anaerobacillus sp. CMMVII]|uniref:DUF4145 domain-containing protein n=1 Tax=Anaerobacillus sp. CMMVII TaxID=2755588 RepID=UPI0021B76053|nr:DUF4145 domain-containing protein [Anaerobacillus sp. CMMVII]MCT8139200.1 DUF4145 domain-containing protein [Anaerobacillus sp. CMMVII]
MTSIFAFVEKFSKELAELAYRIEEQLYDQPQAALMQGRLFSEELVKLISNEEGIEEVFGLKHAERIHKLYRQNAIEEDLYMKLELVRKKGNKAVHDLKEAEIIDVLQVHQYLYELSVWYMQVYVSYDFEAPKYELPLKKTVENTDLDTLIKPYLEQAYQKIDEMWNEVNQQLQALRAEKELAEPSIKTNKVPTIKGTLVIKEKDMLYKTFYKNNFILTNETTKAAEFEHGSNKEVVYLLPNKKISIVLNPETIAEDLKTSERVSHSTALRRFPKQIRNGKTPISYGYSFKFKTKIELDQFLQSFGGALDELN